MKTHRFPEHVSQAAVRAAAGPVFVLSLLAIALQLPWLALVLVVDFGLRVFAGLRWSFLSCAAGRFLVPLFNIRGDQIPYPPKRFAASIGLSLSALELFLSFCAGCKIYGLLIRLHIVPEHSCPQCSLR